MACFFFQSVVAQGQSLDDARIGLAALAEFIQRQLVIVILIHLAEDLVHSSLRRILVLLLWCLTLKRKKKRKRKLQLTSKLGLSKF